MFKYRIAASLAVFWSCFLVIPAHAESESQGRANLVITPNHYPVNLSESGSATTVITAADIEAKGALSAVDALQSVPGLEIVQSGGIGTATSIFLRGASSDQTLVLIDGHRVNDNAVGLFDPSILSANAIERIEIVRGPQSVRYGSEALGGVINIITKKGKDGFSTRARALGGSYGTHEEVVELSGGSDELTGYLSISNLSSDGFSVANSKNGNDEDDAYDNQAVYGRISARPTEESEVSLFARYQRAETELDGFAFGTGAVDDPNAEQEREFTQAGFEASTTLGAITPSLKAAHVNDDLRGRDPDTEFNNFDVDSDTTTAEASIDAALPSSDVISLGSYFEHRAAKNEGNFDESSDIVAYFLEYQLRMLEGTLVSAGVRYDDHSDFGDEVTYRLSASQVIAEELLRAHGSVGTGFRAPSFNELYFPNFGNPDLDAETSIGWDVGLEVTLLEGKLLLDTTFFRNDFEDLIGFDSVTFLAANIDEANTYGFENSAKAKLSEQATAELSYTYMKSEDESTGELLPRRPRHRVSLDLVFEPIENLQSSMSLVMVNSRRETDGSRLDNYEVVNLFVSYQLTAHVKPFLRIDNLFDEDYEELAGFGTAGFSAYGGIEVAL